MYRAGYRLRDERCGGPWQISATDSCRSKLPDCSLVRWSQPQPQCGSYSAASCRLRPQSTGSGPGRDLDGTWTNETLLSFPTRSLPGPLIPRIEDAYHSMCTCWASLPLYRGPTKRISLIVRGSDICRRELDGLIRQIHHIGRRLAHPVVRT